MPAAASAATGLVLDPVFLKHDPGPGHPDSPDRFRVLKNGLDRAELIRQCLHIPPRQATEDDLRLCHTRGYLNSVRQDVKRRARTLSTGDTTLGEQSLEAALWAAGGALAAVDAVLTGKVRNAFVTARPPGHHATPSRGMGFCIFNTVAIAARYAQKVCGAGRVLIADWDVHHGNGTQDIFNEDPDVFFFSTHQWPWYPGTGSPDETGAGRGKGTTMNCPFRAGAGRAEILGAFRKKLLPVMADYKPDLVLVSAGFDSRNGDPLGRFRLRDSDFVALTRVLLDIAASSAHGRLVSVLEGGYNLAGLAKASIAHLDTLLAPA